MLHWFRARSRTRRKARELYGVVVAAARSPGYYEGFSVPDTPEGRFEMLVIQLFLLLERIKKVPNTGQDLAQGVIEAFVADMDGAMREMGVGDLTVPKKVRRAAAAFYERGAAYRAALQAENQAELAACLGRYILPEVPALDEVAKANMWALAGHVVDRAAALAAASDDAILEGMPAVFHRRP